MLTTIQTACWELLLKKKKKKQLHSRTHPQSHLLHSSIYILIIILYFCICGQNTTHCGICCMNISKKEYCLDEPLYKIGS